MADVKISALPAATTPLAGTEVLPIVQSATTKQVAVSDLTAGRAMSASSLTLTTPLGVVSGGTGLTSLTSGYIPYGNGTGAFSSGSGLQFDGTNLGVGGTLSAWSGVGAIQIYGGGAFATSSSYARFMSNVYYNGGWKYIQAQEAARYEQAAGAHVFYSAPSGSAGSTISFTQAMTLTSDGNLGLGTSSPSNFGAGYKTLDVAGSSGAGVVQVKSTSVTSRWQADESGALLFKTVTNHPIQFYTNDQPAVRIDTSGNLLVGTTTSRNRLTVASGNTVTAPTLGTLSGTTFFGGSDLGYGLLSGQAASGDYWFQVQRVDASATAYNLRLQPSGGNVQIGNLTTNGAVYSNGTALTNTNPSDARLKDDIEPIKWGLSEILSLRPVSFKWKNDPKKIRSTSYGFVAQEAQPVMTELVSEFEQDGKTYLGLDVVGINTTLVRAIQELAAKVSALEARI